MYGRRGGARWRGRPATAVRRSPLRHDFPSLQGSRDSFQTILPREARTQDPFVEDVADVIDTADACCLELLHRVSKFTFA